MDVQKLIEEVKSMTVVELNELVKALEEEFGVSAAAPVAVAGRGKDGIQHRPQRHRREQDRRYQGGPRIHRSRTCGSEEGCRKPRRAERSRSQGGRGRGACEAQRSRRGCRIAIKEILPQTNCLR